MTCTCSRHFQVTLIFTDLSFGCSSFFICFLCSLCCRSGVKCHQWVYQTAPLKVHTHPHLPLAGLLWVIFQHHLLLFLPFLLLPTSLSCLHRMGTPVASLAMLAGCLHSPPVSGHVAASLDPGPPCSCSSQPCPWPAGHRHTPVNTVRLQASPPPPHSRQSPPQRLAHLPADPAGLHVVQQPQSKLHHLIRVLGHILHCKG